MPESPETPASSEFESLARAALLEITPAATVGDYVGSVDEGDGAVSLLFASAMRGYVDWRWTVTVATVDGEQPTVLEAELMPAEGALLAPDWVPWSDRLAEYKAAQEAADAEAAAAAVDEAEGSSDDDDDESDDEDDDDLDEDDDEDDDELDEDDVLGNDVLHGGDLDGVDIDDPDESDDDEEDDDEDDEEDDDFDEGEKTY